MNLFQHWDSSLAGAIILSGLVIVFVALVILIGVVQITGKLAGSSAPAPKPPEKPFAPAPAPKAAPAPVPVPAVRAGIPGETVAAISAAVHAMMEEEAPGVEYVVKSIQPRGATRMQRPVWGFAGMQQNTRPF